jgi:hypothetical protein
MKSSHFNLTYKDENPSKSERECGSLRERERASLCLKVEEDEK